MDGLVPSLVVAVVTGVVSGAFNWGMLRVTLAWLRRDVDAAHRRIDELVRR